jgi:ABC-type transport system involved in multi-copper enzyme maturation permease subunit
MKIRIGLGPVFAYEWLLTSRRWQIYAARSLFVLLLLAGLFFVWNSQLSSDRTRSAIRQQAEVGEQVFYALISIQLTLIMLAAPAATAGSVCLDKMRGTLVHLFVTDLSNVEIILGKLAARLAPVIGLVGCTVPLLFLSTLFGGIDPEALAGAFLVTLAIAILGCTLALVLSVWAARAHEVLLATYLVWLFMLLAGPIWDFFRRRPPSILPPRPDWFDEVNPFWLAFAPYSVPGRIDLGDYLIYVGVVLAGCAVLLFVAMWSIRAVTIRQSARASQEPRRIWVFKDRIRPRGLLFGPSLDRNPALWREWHRKQPSRWIRFVWLTYLAGAVLFSFFAIAEVLGSQVAGFWSYEAAMIVNALQVGIGFLLLSIISVASLSEDRMRGLLEPLLATPLSTPSIVWARWWGTYRQVFSLTILPVAVVSSIAWVTDHWLVLVVFVVLLFSYGAVITSLGLALATWVAHFGRALAGSIAIYVLVSLGWVFMLAMLFPTGGGDVEGLACASPIFGSVFLTQAMTDTGFGRGVNAVGYGVFWIFAYFAVAIGLYLAVLYSFDRNVGRISMRRSKNNRIRPGPALAESLAKVE